MMMDAGDDSSDEETVPIPTTTPANAVAASVLAAAATVAASTTACKTSFAIAGTAIAAIPIIIDAATNHRTTPPQPTDSGFDAAQSTAAFSSAAVYRGSDDQGRAPEVTVEEPVYAQKRSTAVAIRKTDASNGGGISFGDIGAFRDSDNFGDKVRSRMREPHTRMHARTDARTHAPTLAHTHAHPLIPHDATIPPAGAVSEPD